MFNMTACRNKFPLCQISVRGSAMASFSALPTPKAGAGVLKLLRQFKSDPAAAAAYGEACLARTRAVEPKLKAFEYLPIDVAPKNGRLADFSGSCAGDGCLGGGAAAQSRRHHLRQDGVDRIRLAPSRADGQSLESPAYARRLVIRLCGGGRGGPGAAGAGHAAAGLGDSSRRVQRRGRLP